MTGQTISHYRILEKLGEGAMGAVYKAEDTKLRRTVALKFLLKQEPELRERFLREAQAAAALHHPNICTLFEIDEEHGFLAMEFVEGPTLKEKIKERPLKLEEALEIAGQICEGLAEAHAKGVVHRDIKPGNILLTLKGQVKITDFGLAALADKTRLTKSGVSMGTPAYMSPEQVQGKPVDRRTDIWSFGAVLHEMVTGQLPFSGEQEAAVANAILTAEPEPPTALRSGLPVEFDRIVAKALSKDAGTRYQNAGDIAVDLRRLRLGAASKSKPAGAWPPAAYFLLGSSLTLAGVVIVYFALRSLGILVTAQPAPLPQPRIVPLTSYGGNERAGAISPDGRLFAFVSDHGGVADIWIRQVSGGEPVRITKDEFVESDLVFAPDGESIYFVRGEEERDWLGALPTSLWIIPALGGRPRKILDGAQGISISGDGKRLAYQRRVSIVEVAQSDGTSAKQVHQGPRIRTVSFSPDGRSLAFAQGELFETRNLFVLDLNGGAIRSATRYSSGGIYSQAWLPDGSGLVYSRAPVDSAPLSDTMDLGIVSLSGGPERQISLNVNSRLVSPSISRDGKRMVATLETIQREIWQAPWRGDPAANSKAAFRLLDSTQSPFWQHLSPRGVSLLYNSPAAGTRNLWTYPMDRSGSPRQITTITGGSVTHSAWSPDETRIAYSLTEGGNPDIWIVNTDGSNPVRLTDHASADFWPTWSSDGKWVAFTSTRSGSAQLWKVPARGGAAIQINDRHGYRSDWSPVDGRIAYIGRGSAEIADAATGKPLLRLSVRSDFLSWSPDGKRLASVEGHGSNKVVVYDAVTGQAVGGVEFPANFHFIFRVSWTKDGTSLILNRQEFISRVTLIENFR